MIAPVRKINLIAPLEHQEEIFDLLQSLGSAHIVPARPDALETDMSVLDNQIEQNKYQLSKIKFVLGFLKTSLPVKLSLGEKLRATPKVTSYRQIKKKIKNLNVDKISATVTEIEANLAQGQNKIVDLEKQLRDLEPWLNLTNIPETTRFTTTIVGTISLNKYLEFIRELETRTTEIEIETVYTGLREVYLEITYLAEFDPTAREISSRFNFQIQNLEFAKLPSALQAELIDEKRDVTKNLKKWRKYIKEFKPFIEPLRMAEDYLTWESQKLQAKKQITSTRHFLKLTAWIKTDHLKSLQTALKDVTPNCLIKIVKPAPADQPPIIIENNQLIRPFETVTSLYGMPKYNELDPTPYLAPFFIVFFALCLTDAGYGLLMAIIAFGAIKIFRIPRANQKLFRLLGFGGILTIITGALFGGWFGIDVGSLSPGPVKNFIKFFQVVDPMKDTMLFMVIAFSLGLIQLWFARVVKIIAAHKVRHKFDMVAAASWASFILAGMLLLISYRLPFPLFTKVLLYTILLLAVELVVIESWNIKNIFVKPLVGAVNVIQGLIGILSDMLSYSRLMALGLATGIIALIINTIAAIFRDLIPYFGWVVWVVILIGGHAFNIAINALGGFIHSGRLQFVEFFPKFMEGGGQKFVPFKRVSKHFILKS